MNEVLLYVDVILSVPGVIIATIGLLCDSYRTSNSSCYKAGRYVGTVGRGGLVSIIVGIYFLTQELKKFDVIFAFIAIILNYNVFIIWLNVLQSYFTSYSNK